ncbi:MAG: site-specific integrase [Rhodobacteraceae bacterium]|nr:site-specific integrase [Paracoccaceae bacterium]
MKHEFTDRYLSSLKAPDEGRLEVSDTRRAGLRFRLTAHGNATWVYEKRIKGGVKRKHTLGRWPTPISLARARKIALELEVEAAQGIDRVALLKAKRIEDAAKLASLSTVQQVINTYNDLHLSHLRTGIERKRVIERALTKHLGKSIADLTRKDIQEAIDAKAMEGHKVYANRIRGMLLALTNWAWQRDYIDNPVGAGLAKAIRETARERILGISEIRIIWNATYNMGELWGPFLRVLMLTGQRRGEIAQLRWDQVDLVNRQIVKSGAETKNGKPHTTHLSQPALANLEGLTQSASKFVFSTTGKTPVSGFSPMKRKLDKILGDNFEPWHLHDIRTSFATALANAGEPEAVVDRILNHSASGSAPSAVARVYNQAEQLPQRARVLDKWAEIVTGKMAKIVRIG